MRSILTFDAGLGLGLGKWRVQSAQPVKLLLGMAALGSALALCKPVHAEVWAFVDARGVAHFAVERLDERYELFLNGGEVLQAGQEASQAAAPPAALPTGLAERALPATPAQSRLLAYLAQSPGYLAVQSHLADAALTHGIDPHLLKALIVAESGFDAQAVSPKGAVGLMQLIVPTAERYGVKADRQASVRQKLTDPRTNLRAGTLYLRDLLALFPGRLDLALAAYNAGEGAVQRAGNRVPNYPETQNYVKTVLQLYAHLQPLARLAAPALPSAVQAAPRVRLEMMGGASGRGNMPAFSGSPLLRPTP